MSEGGDRSRESAVACVDRAGRNARQRVCMTVSSMGGRRCAPRSGGEAIGRSYASSDRSTAATGRRALARAGIAVSAVTATTVPATVASSHHAEGVGA